MKEIKELIRIITSRTPKKIPLFDLRKNSDGKEGVFFQKITADEYASDEDAAREIYNSTPKDSRYITLKSRVRKKLLNHLFFLDLSDSKVAAAYRFEQECNHMLYQAKILINEGEYTVSEDLLRQTLRYAQDFGFTSIAISCLEMFRLNYIRNGKGDLFYKNQSLLEQQRLIAQCEQEAADIYYISRLELNRSVQSRKKYLPKLVELLPRLKGLWQRSNSYNVYDFYYKLDLWHKELIGNFDEIIRITSSSEDLLEQNLINSRRFNDRYNKYMSVYAHLRAKKLEEGLQLASTYLPSFDASSDNWFAFMENYFLLAMHNASYDVALSLLKNVDQNAFYVKLSQRAKERWMLYRAYLYFVNPSEDLLKHFNYQDFIASVPEYSKDKQGFHIAILILQFLHYLRQGETEALIYRMESLRKYAGAHLKDSSSTRSKTFFKLLVLAVREDLHPSRSRTKSKYLFGRLQAAPPPGDAFAEIEIIPYEYVWELIIKIIERQYQHV